jgi:hypothetical protein
MFPLAGTSYPRSSDELKTAIRNSLAEVFQLPSGNSVVKIEGGVWPMLGRVVVDLSGAVLKVTEMPPRPIPQQPREPGLTVGELQILGRPIRYERSRLDLALNARSLRFDFAHDATGRAMLVLADATDGHVDLKMSKSDLQAALFSAATMAAKAHGVAIQDLQLNLASGGPRSFEGDLRVKAKKIMMSGVVHLRGKIDIDDSLVATLSNLACGGEGMIGSMAAALINTHLKANEGKKIPLMAFSMGDVSLHDVRIAVTEVIDVTAEFGRK